jgi:biopolymer transport protein ExbB/TolQ
VIAYLLHAFSGPAGLFMYMLLAVAAFAIGVTVDRVMQVARFRVNSEDVLQRVAGKQALGSTPLEAVIAAGAAQPDYEHAWDAMTAESIRAEQLIRRRIPYLSTVASLATMIGLFGTVYGLILAFGSMGDLAAAERAAHLSEGSSTAMASTAFGLLVAIPAMAAHAALDAWARDQLAEIERTATRFALLLPRA